MVAIESRRELAQHLQAQMAASRGYGNWVAAAEEEVETSGRTLVKTYLLEAHGPGDYEATLERLEEVGGAAGLRTTPTRDHELFRLAGTDIELWCDTSMGRFWRLHTTAPVKLADDSRDALIRAASWLDNVWLPPDYLEAFPEMVGAQMLTFSLSHDRRPLQRKRPPFSGSDFFVTLRLWAQDAEERLARLKGAEVLPHGVSIRSVKLHSGGQPDEEYCVAEYFHTGKVTASGTSFDAHNRLIVRALRDYGHLVRSIEERFALGPRTIDGHPVVAGNPITIDVNWDVDDLGYAVKRVFSSAQPFRLFGLPEALSPDHFRAHAVDLHFGGVLTFDITRERVVIQLPAGVCGNTIVRFHNALRFHVNSDASIRGLDAAGAEHREAS